MEAKLINDGKQIQIILDYDEDGWPTGGETDPKMAKNVCHATTGGNQPIAAIRGPSGQPVKLGVNLFSANPEYDATARKVRDAKATVAAAGE